MSRVPSNPALHNQGIALSVARGKERADKDCGDSDRRPSLFIISLGLLSRFTEIFVRFFTPTPGPIMVGCVSYFYIIGFY